MAVELTANALQTIEASQNVLFTDTAIPCSRGYVVHREGAGIVTLRGLVNGCNGFARYKVAFFGNIGLPADGTPQTISIALAINGEAVPTTTASDTPATVDRIFNASTAMFVDVPKGCCYTIAVKNVTAPAESITVQNANLMIERVA